MRLTEDTVELTNEEYTTILRVSRLTPIVGITRIHVYNAFNESYSLEDCERAIRLVKDKKYTIVE